jgi:hypothetical protein
MRRLTFDSPLLHMACLAFPFLLAACNKSTSPTPTPAFNVSASINGTPTTFNAIITVDSLSIPGTVYIVAHSDSANLTPLLEITLNNTPLKPGTYPYSNNSSGPDSSGGSGGSGGPSGAYGAANTGLLGYTNWLLGGAVQYPAISDTVTLTNVNPSWFSGTFQGTCAYSADSVVSITNGQFTVGYPRH